MQTPSHPTGFHCHTFDTNLLKQIIEVGVDTAVRQLCQQRGIAIQSIDQAEWVHMILLHITDEMTQMAESHILLPSDIDEEIEEEIAELVDTEIHREKPKECASMVVPMHGLLRLPSHAGVLWRKIFEKRPE